MDCFHLERLLLRVILRVMLVYIAAVSRVGDVCGFCQTAAFLWA